MSREHGFDRGKRSERGSDARRPEKRTPTPGKGTLSEGIGASETAAAVQRAAVTSAAPVTGTARLTLEALFGRAVQRAPIVDPGPASDQAVHAAAAQGVATPASSLPYGDQIQRLFGRHDVSSIRAHVGGAAAASAHDMGARAYATGNHVVFGGEPDLHTAAHETAHVVQQRGGVQLKGGVGEAGDAYEQHADAVADRVVQGRSAESLLDAYADTPSSGSGAVQRMGSGKDNSVGSSSSGSDEELESEQDTEDENFRFEHHESSNVLTVDSGVIAPFVRALARGSEGSRTDASDTYSDQSDDDHRGSEQDPDATEREDRAHQPGPLTADPMPRMRTQILKPGLNNGLCLIPLVGQIANLNCGWYSSKAVLHHWAQRLSPTDKDQKVPIPGWQHRYSFGWDPRREGTAEIRTAFQLLTVPDKLWEWKQLLLQHGPLLAGGKLGLANWGTVGGVKLGPEHFLIIVGVDGNDSQAQPTRMAYKDPLLVVDTVMWTSYAKMKPRITDLQGVNEDRARELLPHLNPNIQMK